MRRLPVWSYLFSDNGRAVQCRLTLVLGSASALITINRGLRSGLHQQRDLVLRASSFIRTASGLRLDLRRQNDITLSVA